VRGFSGLPERNPRARRVWRASHGPVRKGSAGESAICIGRTIWLRRPRDLSHRHGVPRTQSKRVGLVPRCNRKCNVGIKRTGGCNRHSSWTHAAVSPGDADVRVSFSTYYRPESRWSVVSATLSLRVFPGEPPLVVVQPQGGRVMARTVRDDATQGISGATVEIVLAIMPGVRPLRAAPAAIASIHRSCAVLRRFTRGRRDITTQCSPGYRGRVLRRTITHNNPAHSKASASPAWWRARTPTRTCPLQRLRPPV